MAQNRAHSAPRERGVTAGAVVAHESTEALGLSDNGFLCRARSTSARRATMKSSAAAPRTGGAPAGEAGDACRERRGAQIWMPLWRPRRLSCREPCRWKSPRAEPGVGVKCRPGVEKLRYRPKIQSGVFHHGMQLEYETRAHMQRRSVAGQSHAHSVWTSIRKSASTTL